MKSPVKTARFWLLALALSGCSSPPAPPPWDVPALVGPRIDAVKNTLGPPAEESAPDASTGQSTWKRADTTLSATWKTSNKRVTTWTLMARDQQHAASEDNRAALLAPGQLKENDPRYSLDWIEAPDRPLFYTGVRITPALKNHSITLRLSGSQALVEVSYAFTGSGAKSDGTLTIAPWEESFSLPDDTQISLKATLAKTIGGGGSNIQIDILSDGKVVGTAASTGSSVHCEAEL